jgi:hypothetical protein
VSGGSSGNRFGWLSDEEDPRVEEVLREDTQAPSPASPLAQTLGPADGVPGVTGRAVTGRRRRNRAKNPKALRNDPERMMAGARIRRDVRRRVEQALADPEVGEGTNYSLLVESLLVRWLLEVGYPMDER